MFQIVAFKIHAIIKTVYCFKWLPWTSTGNSHYWLKGVPWNQLKSENIETSHLPSALKEPLQIDYILNMLCYGTSMNINILLTYLLKTSLTHFMILACFDTPWNTLENQRFANVSRGHRNRPVPWHELKFIQSSVTYSVTYISNWR